MIHHFRKRSGFWLGFLTLKIIVLRVAWKLTFSFQISISWAAKAKWTNVIRRFPSMKPLCCLLSSNPANECFWQWVKSASTADSTARDTCIGWKSEFHARSWSAPTRNTPYSSIFRPARLVLGWLNCRGCSPQSRSSTSTVNQSDLIIPEQCLFSVEGRNVHFVSFHKVWNTIIFLH